ncbi:hypothetical protein OTU49_008341 [Cherax quadricarinatus]|uniref:ABC1 atypical kinase-like domain-containing protein n=2 Tax=Cherax quadricarinatus TaxID=27406 RepID=A0AAW0WS83_CHEQU
MAKPPRGSDLVTMLRGLSRVGSALVDTKSQEANKAWATSSLRPLIVQGSTNLQDTINRVLQEPQTVQKDVSKSAVEILARISMVTSGIKAFRVTSASAAEFSDKAEERYDPMYDPSVQELNIEEIMMKNTMDGHADPIMNEATHDVDKKIASRLSSAQEVSSNIVETVRGTRDEINKRIEQFEPLLDAKKFEREITEEHLKVLDDKLSEIQGIAYGQDFKILKEVEHSKPLEEVLQDVDKEQISDRKGKTGSAYSAQCRDKQEVQSTNPSKNTKENGSLPDSSLHEIGVEEVVMQEALSGHSDKFLSELSQSSDELLTGALSNIQEVVHNISEIKEGSIGILEQFEPLLDVRNIQEREITVEQLQVLEDELQGLQGITCENDFKIFRKDEYSQPVEVKHDIVNELVSSEKTKIDNCAQELVEKVVTPASSPLAAVENSSAVAATTAPTSTTIGAATTVHALGNKAQASSKEKPKSHYGSAMCQPSQEATFSTATVISTIDSSPPGPVTRDTDEHNASSNNSHNLKDQTNAAHTKPKPRLLGKKPLAKEKPKSTLADTAQARKVPHSRMGRLMSFGGLAAGLGVGTIAEMTRRSLGVKEGNGSGSLLDGSPFLTEANAKRIVNTLCKVRGAALKLGQMLSIQDSALINPQIQKIFDRVRQSADFMPTWQLEGAIAQQLGQDWKSKIASFEEKPFAAASIGQVHLATLHDGRSVAMKIQYPGVAQGIESDINNLISTLSVANILPEGLFVDSIVEVAKRELRWECDYIREAECTRRFSELVKTYPEYYVPEVISELCTSQVFTTELIDGIPVDHCIDMDQETRNFICENILGLCLLELFRFGFMQTDPNWSNFFYNAETEQVALLDFGACRDYSKDFVDKYIHLIHGAAIKDHEKVLHYSQELGFLTGCEAKVMEEAHVDAIMILGEAFQEDKPFHFGNQDTTYRIQHLVPVMLSHRMCAPPEESYSLHRKMSGVFLLCAKLNGIVKCYSMFQEVFSSYKFGGTWEDFHAGKL